MDAGQAKLKAVKAEILAVLKKHDMAGFVTLHGGDDWGEVFWELWPSWSILKGDYPSIRLVSKLADYDGDVEKQRHGQAQTAQMVRHIATSTATTALQFLQLAGYVDKALGAEHVDGDFIPDERKDV